MSGRTALVDAVAGLTHVAAVDRLATSATASRTPGGIVVAAFAVARALWHRWNAAQRRRRDAQSIRSALQALDDRALRDLGFCRDEIASVAAETTGAAAPSRVRTTRGAYTDTI